MTNEIEIIYDGDNEESWGSYSPDHLSSECDKCLKNVGIHNLKPVSFIYHDYNDYIHSDVLYPRMYHQYYVCQKCFNYC